MTDQASEAVETLKRFRSLIQRWFDGEYVEGRSYDDFTEPERERAKRDLRSQINQSIARARSLVADAGVKTLYQFVPSPTIGGAVFVADLFDVIFIDPHERSYIPELSDAIDQAIGIYKGGYKPGPKGDSELRIELSGELSSKGTMLKVGESQVPLTPRPLELFMNLLVALNAEPGGWVSVQTLEDEANLGSVDQALARLREPFKALEDIDSKQLIERSLSRVRLSVPRENVVYNKEALEGHPDAIIVALAKKLP